MELRIYEQLISDLLVNDAIIAAGCMVKGEQAREWCEGLVGTTERGSPGLGLDMSQEISVTAYMVQAVADNTCRCLQENVILYVLAVDDLLHLVNVLWCGR